MNELSQQHKQRSNANHDAGSSWSVEKEIELEMVRNQLEKAIGEEWMAKTNLENVLEDNYKREEEILELTQLLKDRETAKLEEIQALKDEHDYQMIELNRGIGQTETQKSIELAEKLDLAETNLRSAQLERDASKKTKERFLCLISDFVKMSSVVETKVNAQLSTSSLGSSSLSPTQSLRSNATDQPVDEQTGSTSTTSTADEGLGLSRCFADGFISGSEVNPDYEEAVLREVFIAVQRSFERLLHELRLRKDKSNETEKSLERERKKNEELEDNLQETSLAKLQFETENSLVKRQMEEMVTESQTRLDEMQAQLDKKDARILQLTDELDSSEEDLARLRQAFNREKDQRQGLALKTDGKILSLNDRIGEERRLNAEKSRQVEDLEKTSAALRREVDVMKRQKQFRRIEEFEDDVEKLRKKCVDSEADAFAAHQTLERVRNEADIQNRHLTQLIDEIKRQHNEEIEHLLEVKENDLKSLHARELDKIQLETASRNNQDDMESFRKELEAFHQKKMCDLLKQKEEELQAQHRKELENLERENQKEMERLHSRHAEDIDDIERFMESEKQKQIKKLVENHRSEIADFEEELNRKERALEMAEKKLLKVGEETRTEMERLNEVHARELNDMRTEFDLQNARSLQSSAERYGKEIQHLRNRLNAAETTVEAFNIKGKENKLEKNHEQLVRELENGLENHRKQIDELEKRLLESQKQKDRILEKIDSTREEERNKLTLALTKECDMRIEEMYHSHQHELDRVKEEILKNQDFTALVQQKYELELREKAEEIADAKAQHVRELGMLQSRLEAENEKRFRDLSGKYEEEFEALRAELEKKRDVLVKDMENRHSCEMEEMKIFVDQIVQHRDEILGKAKRDIQLNESEMVLLKGNLNVLQQKLIDQQDRFEREILRERDKINDLEMKHFTEIEDLKRQHRDYLNVSAAEYRREMSRLRTELCRGSDLLKDLNIEHSREISQLKADLERRYHNSGTEAVITGCLENPEKFVPEYKEKSRRDDEYMRSNGVLERQKLLEENEALRRLIKDCIEDFETKGSEATDWRTKILTCFYEVLMKQLKRVTVCEIYRPCLSENRVEELKNFIELKMIQQEAWFAEGFGRVISVDRNFMLAEIDSLRHEIVGIRQEVLDDGRNLSEKVNGSEAQFQERLKNQLNSANMQLNREREFSSELQSTLAAEKILIEELKDQLSRERSAGERLKERSSRLEAELAAMENELQIERNKLIATLKELDERRSHRKEVSPDRSFKAINNNRTQNSFANRPTHARELDSDNVDYENRSRKVPAKTFRNPRTRTERKAGPRNAQSPRRPSLPSTRSRSPDNVPDATSATIRRSGFLSRSLDSHGSFVRSSPSIFDSRKSE